MGHCLSIPHAATPIHTHKHPFTHKFKPKQPSYPHLQPIPKHKTRFITAIPSSPLPPPTRHVHFAPTPPLLPSHAHFTPTTPKPPRPPSVRVRFTKPIWDSSSSSSSKTRPSSRPVSPLTTTLPRPPRYEAMAKKHKIKRKPLPPASASMNRSNATTTFLPSLRSPSSSSLRLPAVLPGRSSTTTTTVRESSSSSAPPVPPKRPLSLSLSLSLPCPRVPPKIPLSPPPPLPPPRRVAAPPPPLSHAAHYPSPSSSSCSLPSTTQAPTTFQLRGRRRRRRGGSHNNNNNSNNDSTTPPPPPRISRSRPYVPDLGRWECVRDGGKAVRSGGVGEAWMSGGLGGRRPGGGDGEG